MATLHLTLKRQWFDMIASGAKTAEYREIKPYWSKRLLWKSLDTVHFRNGYSANAPTMIVELEGISTGIGRPEWGAPSTPVYILRLGVILQAPQV